MISRVKNAEEHAFFYITYLKTKSLLYKEKRLSLEMVWRIFTVETVEIKYLPNALYLYTWHIMTAHVYM